MWRIIQSTTNNFHWLLFYSKTNTRKWWKRFTKNVLCRNKRSPKFLQIQKLILKYNHLVQNFLHFDFRSHLQLSLRTFLLLIHNKNHIGQTKKNAFLLAVRCARHAWCQLVGWTKNLAGWPNEAMSLWLALNQGQPRS